MPITVKRKIFSGPIIEQLVYNVPDGTPNIEDYDPDKQLRKRFRDEEERAAFLKEISRRVHFRNFMANFSPTSLYSTLTFDDENEVHTFREAKRIRRNFCRVLQYAYPDAVFFIYMGRGKSTNRIHFHMVSEGIPEDFISRKWKYGTIKRIEHLRKHNYYDGVDHGQDYTGLANYLFNHWTPEVGGHRWFQTKNARKPDRRPAKEVHIRGSYSAKRPPRAPKGYQLVETKTTKYGYHYFKYVWMPPKPKEKRRLEMSGGGLLS